jgi:hypothetical protein
MKENQVDIAHLNAINSVFLDCDLARTGLVSQRAFFLQLAAQNLQLPADFLFNIIKDMQVANSSDEQEAKGIMNGPGETGSQQ